MRLVYNAYISRIYKETRKNVKTKMLFKFKYHSSMHCSCIMTVSNDERKVKKMYSKQLNTPLRANVGHLDATTYFIQVLLSSC
jgi:hypothetical protein